MGRDLLKDSTGCVKHVDSKESAVITAVLKDVDDVAINKGVLQSLTLTLVNAEDGAVLNGRDSQDILDANDGSVTEDGVVTIKLQPADNAVCGANMNEIEEHYATLRWTYADTDGDPMSGAHQWVIQVFASP